MEAETMQLIYLGVIALAVMTRNIIGWLKSNQKFDWRQFVVSSLPALVVGGTAAFDVEPVWSLKTAFALFLAAGGFAEFQSLAMPSKKLGRALFAKK